MRVASEQLPIGACLLRGELYNGTFEGCPGVTAWDREWRWLGKSKAVIILQTRGAEVSAAVDKVHLQAFSNLVVSARVTACKYAS